MAAEQGKNKKNDVSFTTEIVRVNTVKGQFGKENIVIADSYRVLTD